jgi:hypothetical protein
LGDKIHFHAARNCHEKKGEFYFSGKFEIDEKEKKVSDKWLVVEMSKS